MVLVLRQLSPPPRGGNVAISEVSLQSVYINESLLAFATLLSTWIMSKLERRGRRYGYGETRRLQTFFAGLGWGVILISLLVVLLWKSGLLIIERQLIFGLDVLCYGVLWFFAFCLLGIFEESISHGFLLYTLTRGHTRFYRRVFQTRYSATLGFWTSAAILCLVFLLCPQRQPRRVPVRAGLSLPHRNVCLPEHLAHRLALVCGWDSCRLGLGSVLPFGRS